MARKAAARFEEFFAIDGIALGLSFGPRTVQAGLPDKRRKRADLVVGQPESRHFGSGTKCGRILDPYRNPLLAQLEPDILEIRTDLLLILHEELRPLVQLADARFEIAGAHAQAFCFGVMPLGFLVALGLIARFRLAIALQPVFVLLVLQRLDLFPDIRES